MMLPESGCVLVLSPHTDDGEIGCGGVIHRLIAEGHAVHYLALSSCAESLPPQWPRDTLEVEVREATKRLGVAPVHLHLMDFTVRKFHERRQDILDALVDFKERLDPDLVFMPSSDDLHQDHAVVAAEGIRAFKDRSVLAYEMPWNNIAFETRAFFALREENIAAKVHALDAYQSQLHRPYMNPEFVRALAHVRGSSIRAEFAEVFDVPRMVMR